MKLSNKDRNDDEEVQFILIDSPVGPYSQEDEIIAWLAELRKMPDLPEVKQAINEAKSWLRLRKKKGK